MYRQGYIYKIRVRRKIKNATQVVRSARCRKQSSFEASR